MKHLKNLATTFWQDERGQSTTEYILILSVVVMVAMKFKTMFVSKMIGATTQLGGDIDSALQQQN